MRITAIVFVSTQEKGSKRTKRNDSKRIAFVRTKESVRRRNKQCSKVWLNILIDRFFTLNNLIELNDLDSTLPMFKKKMKIMFTNF